MASLLVCLTVRGSACLPFDPLRQRRLDFSDPDPLEYDFGCLPNETLAMNTYSVYKRV